MSACGETFAECVCSLAPGHELPHVCLQKPYGVTCGGSWNEPTGEGIVCFPSLASVRAGLRAQGWDEQRIEEFISFSRSSIPPEKLADVIDADES